MCTMNSARSSIDADGPYHASTSSSGSPRGVRSTTSLSSRGVGPPCPWNSSGDTRSSSTTRGNRFAEAVTNRSREPRFSALVNAADGPTRRRGLRLKIETTLVSVTSPLWQGHARRSLQPPRQPVVGLVRAYLVGEAALGRLLVDDEQLGTGHVG